MKEFDLIRQFFIDQQIAKRSDVLLGIGDDCALLSVPKGQVLAVSIDTSVAGVHFPHHTPPAAIAHKALAVSLSDMAAMGAEPAWITISATLPEFDGKWLKAFSEGFFNLASEFNVELVGGDTTCGPLSITTQVHGFVPPAQALRRSDAKVGDAIFVTGTLGDAGFGLQLALGKKTVSADDYQYFINRLNYPTPRVNEGIALREFANAAIDLSDGLAGDLRHILQQSQVGACLDLAAIPLSKQLKAQLPFEDAIKLALSAGDDYEICFSVSSEKVTDLLTAAANWSVPITRIGTIEAEKGLRGKGLDDDIKKLEYLGYEHF